MEEEKDYEGHAERIARLSREINDGLDQADPREPVETTPGMNEIEMTLRIYERAAAIILADIANNFDQLAEKSKVAAKAFFAGKDQE